MLCCVCLYQYYVFIGYPDNFSLIFQSILCHSLSISCRPMPCHDASQCHVLLSQSCVVSCLSMLCCHACQCCVVMPVNVMSCAGQYHIMFHMPVNVMCSSMSCHVMCLSMSCICQCHVMSCICQCCHVVSGVCQCFRVVMLSRCVM